MKQAESIFRTRLGAAWVKGLRYFALIGGNGGMPILLMLAAVLFVYAYVAFLKWLPETFPSFLLMAIVMSVVLTRCSVRTFIHKPDVVFLLPLEHRMGPYYFRQSLLYSSAVQAVTTAFAMSLFLPLYRLRIGDEASFFVALGFVAIFKIWNVYAYWQELRLTNGRGIHLAFRFILNLMLTGLLFYGGSLGLYTLIAAVMLSVTSYYYSRLGKKSRYPWYRLVALEEKRLSTLYAIASFFVDVPRMQQQVKKRAWLSRLLERLPYGKRNGYLYLYTRTFARSGEYFAIYLRLTVVIAVVMAFIPNKYAVLAVYVIGLIFSGVQLPAVAKKYEDSVWLKLYPLNVRDKEQSLARLVFILLTLQSVLLALVFVFSTPSFLFLIALVGTGLLFSYFFSYVYLPKRLKA